MIEQNDSPLERGCAWKCGGGGVFHQRVGKHTPPPLSRGEPTKELMDACKSKL